jgi:hypothetical protein
MANYPNDQHLDQLVTFSGVYAVPHWDSNPDFVRILSLPI